MIWSRPSFACIQNNNVEVSTVRYLGECKRRCELRTDCKSIDFTTRDKENCYLNKLNSAEAGASFKSPCYTDNYNFVDVYMEKI